MTPHAHKTVQAMTSVTMPSRAEMAAAEAELQAIGRAGSLPADLVERLMARATTVPAVPQVARRGTRRVLGLAALVLLAISGIAWAGMNVIWPEQQNSRLTLSFANAVLLATEPGRNEGARTSALSLLDEHCGYALHTLKTLTQDAELPVADRARTLRARLREVMQRASDSPPDPAGLDVVERARVANDPSQTVDARTAAMDDLATITQAGIVAIKIIVREGKVPHESASFWLERLRADLDD
jgi:hypothetical protein